MALTRQMNFKLSYIVGRKLLKKKQVDGFADKTLEEYIQFLVKDTHLSPNAHDFVEAGTGTLLDLWMKNFADNLPYVRFGNNLKMTLGEFKTNNLSELAAESPTFDVPPKGTAIVIGRGPSIFNHKHLDLLAEKIHNGEYRGIICCSDGMLIECLKKEIIPDLTTTVDGSPIITKWFDHELVAKYGPKIKVALNVTSNHQVYELLQRMGCQVYWFNPLFDDWRSNESWTKIQRLMTKSQFQEKPLQAVTAGGNTGTCAWVMALSLFKRAPVALIGIDFGYPEGTNLEETPYFSSVMEGNSPVALKYAYTPVYHPFFKTNALIDMVFNHYRESFLTLNIQTQPWFKKWGGTINCTEGGTLFGSELQCMKFSDFLEKYHE